MKIHIENLLKYEFYNSVGSVLEHTFCVLGNGIQLDNKGYLVTNYKSKETYDYPEPEPLSSIYPWNDKPRFQPFRNLAGCRDIGFKEAVEYFLACLEMTPESIENIKLWKENIDLIRSVLLETPTIEDEYKDPSDIETFIKKLDSKKTYQHPADGTALNEENSVFKVWFLDVQWSDCPTFVEDEVKSLWSSEELGNDNYISKKTVNNELFEEYPNIYFWLKHKGVPDGDKVIIHWWW